MPLGHAVCAASFRQVDKRKKKKEKQETTGKEERHA